MDGKRILLVIGGGIAAYKSLELVRGLKKRGCDVRVILTKGGQEFITPLSAASLSGNKTYTSLFDLGDESEMGHISLSREADLVIVAPATADLMAKLANGLANDLASTVLLATDTPVMMAPAMNVRMWEHNATQRNFTTLKKDGILFAGPVSGDMACGEHGMGRMAEPDGILDAADAFFSSSKMALSGRRIIVTSGPTLEPIDPVRFLSNRSSGRQGSAIATALARQGAEVVFISGPAEAGPPVNASEIKSVETAREMLAAALEALPADAAICAAAVADWRPVKKSNAKLKKGKTSPECLELEENPDILATLGKLKGEKRPKLVIGFAAETDNLIANAKAKLKNKGCDWIIANDVSKDGVMGGDNNQVHIVKPSDVQSWPEMSKAQVADRLAGMIGQQFADKEAGDGG